MNDPRLREPSRFKALVDIAVDIKPESVIDVARQLGLPQGGLSGRTSDEQWASLIMLADESSDRQHFERLLRWLKLQADGKVYQRRLGEWINQKPLADVTAILGYISASAPFIRGAADPVEVEERLSGVSRCIADLITILASPSAGQRLFDGDPDPDRSARHARASAMSASTAIDRLLGGVRLASETARRPSSLGPAVDFSNQMAIRGLLLQDRSSADESLILLLQELNRMRPA